MIPHKGIGALTGDNHQLATVSIIEAILALSGKHVSRYLGDVLFHICE